MTHADLLSFPLLALAIPAGTVLGVSHAGPGPTWRVITYELCLQLACAGISLIVAILTHGAEGMPGASLFALLPAALLVLELGWATTSPYVPKKDD